MLPHSSRHVARSAFAGCLLWVALCAQGCAGLQTPPSSDLSQEEDFTGPLPALPLGTHEMLGKHRRAIEAHYPPVEQLQEGWVQYSDTLRVRYKRGRAVELQKEVPEDFGCQDVAQWLGFEEARVPILKKTRCLWPHNSPRHGLGARVSGVFHLSERTVHLMWEH